MNNLKLQCYDTTVSTTQNICNVSSIVRYDNALGIKYRKEYLLVPEVDR